MTVSAEVSAVVAVYTSHEAAEDAVKELQHDGFDMTKLSIVGQDYQSDEQVIGYYNVGDKMKKWGLRGAFWGGLWGLLFGAAFFVLPGFGPVLVGGPLVALIVTALEDALVVGGLSVLGVALFNLGVPKDSALKYETEIKAGKFLLVVHGPENMTKHAHEILSRNDTGSADLHLATPVAASP